jgi:hypothetical protein
VVAISAKEISPAPNAMRTRANVIISSEIELFGDLDKPRRHERLRRPRRAVGVVVRQGGARVRHVVEVDADVAPHPLKWSIFKPAAMTDRRFGLRTDPFYAPALASQQDSSDIF